MDCEKVGMLICRLRKEKKMTQKVLADKMGISDRTVSKWERGLGCPDVSLLGELSRILGVDLEKILSGDLEPNEADGGNMRRIQFYRCETCGNLLTATGEASVSCCGRKLLPLQVQKADEEHQVKVEVVEDEFYITFSHEMTKQHFINFFAYVSCDQVLIRKLYPEQGNELFIPRMRGGRLYFCCSRHGFFEYGRC